MNKTDVMTLLQASYDPAKSARSGSIGRLDSFGLGLTVLRKLARQIGRDHQLARELWATDNCDARVISLLIDDPKRITREQAEEQVENLVEPVIQHVFCSCDSSLARTPFVVALADDWIASDDPIRRSCGYGLLSEIASSRKKSGPDEAYFLRHLAHIEQRFLDSGRVEGAYAILCIGKRSVSLNTAALRLARLIGPVPYEDDGNCEPFDLVRHLTVDHLRKRLGLPVSA